MWLELGRMAGGGKRFVIGLKKKQKTEDYGPEQAAVSGARFVLSLRFISP